MGGRRVTGRCYVRRGTAGTKKGVNVGREKRKRGAKVERRLEKAEKRLV